MIFISSYFYLNVFINLFLSEFSNYLLSKNVTFKLKNYLMNFIIFISINLVELYSPIISHIESLIFKFYYIAFIKILSKNGIQLNT